MSGSPSTVIIVDDTFFSLISTEDDKEFEKAELLLNYLVFSKKRCYAKTSQNIWNKFKTGVTEDSNAYKYVSTVIAPSSMKCYETQSYEETVMDVITTYSKKCEKILLISDKTYNGLVIEHGEVIQFSIDTFNEFVSSDKQFLEYLKAVNSKV